MAMSPPRWDLSVRWLGFACVAQTQVRVSSVRFTPNGRISCGSHEWGDGWLPTVGPGKEGTMARGLKSP